MSEELYKPIVKTSSFRSSYNDGREALGGASPIIPAPVVDTSTLYFDVATQTTKSWKDATKEFKNTEGNILSGDAKVLPNPQYRAKNTMRLLGLGCVDGLYYVEKVTHSFSKEGGYAQVLSLSKNGVGDSIKSGIVVNTNPPVSPEHDYSAQVVTPPQPAQNTHTVVSGDTLWGLARTYYGDGSKYMTIYNANTNVLSNPDLIIDGQVLVIP